MRWKFPLRAYHHFDNGKHFMTSFPSEFAVSFGGVSALKINFCGPGQRGIRLNVVLPV
jgi:hypothetical protein